MSAETITRPVLTDTFCVCLACLQALVEQRQVCGGGCYGELVLEVAERQAQREMEL